MSSRQSYPHQHFHNPQSETCWLSCLFQCLFHSAVFHQAFEEHLVPSKHTPSEEEPILDALQQTWAEYKEVAASLQPATQVEEEAGEEAGEEEEDDERLVAADELANAFGEGYGDMSEALAMMQDELAQSKNKAAVNIADSMAMLPMTLCEGALPDPAAAWKLAEEWQVVKLSILAVDLSLESPSKKDSKRLAEIWIPQYGSGAGVPSGDLGPHHRLVALVCFMWSCQHYVTFCRRQRDPKRCVFFNDLPSLTIGVPREMDWRDVPDLCGNYHFTPRLAFYEDSRQCPSA